MFRAAARHELDIARVFPRLDARFEAWARLAAPVPLRHMIAIADHGENVQVLEPSQIRRKGNIRQAVFLTGEPAMLCQRLLHLVEELQHALDSRNEMLRAGAVLNHVTPALAFEDVRNSFEHCFSELGALEILMTEGDPETKNRRASVMDIFIQLLDPKPHLRPVVWIARPQPRLWKDVLKVLENDIGLRNNMSVVNERRHHGAAVKLEVPRLLMLPPAAPSACPPRRVLSRRDKPSPFARTATCHCGKASASKLLPDLSIPRAGAC